MPNPFQMPGRWFRSNTHSHSTESDGRLPIAERFAAYRDRGYDFLVLTDHRKVNDISEHSGETFLAISGSEVHPANPYGGDRYHIVAINIHSRTDYDNLHPNDVIAEIEPHSPLAFIDGNPTTTCHADRRSRDDACVGPDRPAAPDADRGGRTDRGARRRLDAGQLRYPGFQLGPVATR